MEVILIAKTDWDNLQTELSNIRNQSGKLGDRVLGMEALLGIKSHIEAEQKIKEIDDTIGQVKEHEIKIAELQSRLEPVTKTVINGTSATVEDTGSIIIP